MRRSNRITQSLRHIVGEFDPVAVTLHTAKCRRGAHHHMRFAIAERGGKSLGGLAVLPAIDQDRRFHWSYRVIRAMPLRSLTSVKCVSQLVPSASAVASGLAPPLPTSHLKPFRPIV